MACEDNALRTAQLGACDDRISVTEDPELGNLAQRGLNCVSQCPLIAVQAVGVNQCGCEERNILAQVQGSRQGHWSGLSSHGDSLVRVRCPALDTLGP